MARPRSRGFFETREALLRAIWEFQFSGLSQTEICERVGLTPSTYAKARGEALVTFEPTPEIVTSLVRSGSDRSDRTVRP